MKPLNPRILRTRKKLADALASLTLERGYENLSVSAVRQRAKVGQATFYRHYKSLDELLIDVMQTAMGEIIEIIKQEETLYDEAVAALAYMKTHRNRLRLYLVLPPTHPVRDIVKEAMVKLITERYQVREASTVPQVMWASHTVESIFSFLDLYLDNIDDHTPEQMATFFVDLILSSAEPRQPYPRND